VAAGWDTNMYVSKNAPELVSMDVSRLLLCTTMDEKVEMLRRRC
jgi:hypothetical protein